MPIYLISAVRWSPNGARVTHVNWSLLDLSRGFGSPLCGAPECDVPVARVAAALRRGDPVFALWPAGGRSLPPLRLRLCPDGQGAESIDTVDAARPLRNLPSLPSLECGFTG